MESLNGLGTMLARLAERRPAFVLRLGRITRPRQPYSKISELKGKVFFRGSEMRVHCGRCGWERLINPAKRGPQGLKAALHCLRLHDWMKHA